jgi:hypothetical protein
MKINIIMKKYKMKINIKMKKINFYLKLIRLKTK